MKLLEVVCAWDRALDMTKPEREEYAKTRDIKLIRERFGMKATRYFIRMISSYHMRTIDESPTLKARAVNAFCAGVERIEHARDVNGTVHPVLQGTEHVEVPGGGKIRVWTVADLEALHNRWAEDEIGGVAYAHSDFPPGEEKRYPPLRSWGPVSDLVDSLHVEKIQRDAVLSNGAPKEAEGVAPLPQLSSEPLGVAATDATATE